MPTAHGTFAHQVTAQSEGTKVQNEEEEESHDYIINIMITSTTPLIVNQSPFLKIKEDLANIKKLEMAKNSRARPKKMLK